MKLAKCFLFDEDSRSSLVYSDPAKVRLSNDNRLDYGLELKKTTAFPLDTNLTIRTGIIRPMRVKKWIGFDEYAEKPPGTDIKYRLLFGPSAASGMWWNGSAWVAAGPTNWNTVNELAANIGTLTPPALEFSILVNLVTTDPTVTPHLRELRVLGDFEFEWWDDLIYDTLIRSLTESIRATTDLEFAVAVDTNVLDFATEYPLENKGYNFTGVRSVYNITDDPNRLQNLAGAYTPGPSNPDGTNNPGSVALTTTVVAGKQLRVSLEIVPEIAVQTNQDYYEPERLPAIIFEKIEDVGSGDRSDQAHNNLPGIAVRNVAAGTAVDVGAPKQFSVRVNYIVMAMLGADQAKIATALDKWVANNRVLRTWGLDEKVRVEQENSLGTDSKSDLNDVRTSGGSLLLRGVCFWLKEDKLVPLVSQVNLDFSNNN